MFSGQSTRMSFRVLLVVALVLSLFDLFGLATGVR